MVLACVVIVYRYGRHSHGVYSYGLQSCGLYSCGSYSCGSYKYGVHSYGCIGLVLLEHLGPRRMLLLALLGERAVCLRNLFGD